MKKQLVSIFVIILINSSFAQETFDAQIFVSDFNDEAITNAQVQLYDTMGVFVSEGTTNAEGRFKMTMKPGKYHIKLKQNGEIKKERIINLPVLAGRRIYNRVRIHVLYQEKKVFTLEDLHFAYSSAIIEDDSYAILDKLVGYLKNEISSNFEIGGHTDSDGSDADNLLLSENRAKAVRNYLIARGIAPERLIAKGYGESVPVADNETDEGMAKNRRTVVRLLE